MDHTAWKSMNKWPGIMAFSSCLISDYKFVHSHFVSLPQTLHRHRLSLGCILGVGYLPLKGTKKYEVKD